MRIHLLRMLSALTMAALLTGIASAAAAQPTADEVLSTLGQSPDVKQRVLNGEFVTADSQAVSDRDLAVSLIFLVKTSPDSLIKQVLSGRLITADSQVQAWALFKNPGNASDLAGLKISSKEAQALAGASAGSSLNLSKPEIAAFNAVSSGNPAAVLQVLRTMLLDRYQGYRARGLDGIPPYARGSGESDLAADLRKASQAARGLEKYLPKFHALILSYPQGMTPDVQESFSWTKSSIRGNPTYVLQHRMAVADGNAWAVMQRQFYVSTGYNGEQAAAGFLPIQGGTLVVYTSHAFTEQVTGFGGSMKRSMGSRVMADQLKSMFEAARKKATQ